MTQDLNLYTMQTLFEQPLEPIDFLVDGLFAQGLYILGGSPKVGKSWLALQLCLAVCTGTPFLGRKTHQGEVLYLALEDGPQRLHSRALRLTQTAPAGLYLCGQALPIGQGLEQQLEHAGRASRYPSRYSGHLAKGALRVRQRDVLRFRLPGCGGAQEHR